MNALAVVVLLFAAAADGDKDAARALLAEGNDLLRDGRPADALERYEAAYDAYASPKILVNIGEALVALERRAEAADTFERALEELEPSDARDAVQARLDELRRSLGSLVVESTPTSTVSLDGRALGATPLSLPHVEPGTRSLELGAPGHAPARRDVEVREMETTTVAVTLAPLELVTPDPEPEPPSETWWLWAGAGVVAAAGVVVAIVALSGGDDFVPGGELGRSSLDEWGRP